MTARLCFVACFLIVGLASACKEKCPSDCTYGRKFLTGQDGDCKCECAPDPCLKKVKECKPNERCILNYVQLLPTHKTALASCELIPDMPLTYSRRTQTTTTRSTTPTTTTTTTTTLSTTTTTTTQEPETTLTEAASTTEEPTTTTESVILTTITLNQETELPDYQSLDLTTSASSSSPSEPLREPEETTITTVSDEVTSEAYTEPTTITETTEETTEETTTASSTFTTTTSTTTTTTEEDELEEETTTIRTTTTERPLERRGNESRINLFIYNSQEEVELSEGQNYDLHCMPCYQDDNATCRWSRPDKIIDGKVWEIRGFAKEDLGGYECEIKSDKGERKISLKLEFDFGRELAESQVESAEKVEKRVSLDDDWMRVDVLPSRIDVDLNDAAEFQCQVGAGLRARLASDMYQWTRVSLDGKERDVLETRENVLRIPLIQLKDIGYYECSVTDQEGLSHQGSAYLGLNRDVEAKQPETGEVTEEKSPETAENVEQTPETAETNVRTTENIEETPTRTDNGVREESDDHRDAQDDTELDISDDYAGSMRSVNIPVGGSFSFKCKKPTDPTDGLEFKRYDNEKQEYLTLTNVEDFPTYQQITIDNVSKNLEGHFFCESTKTGNRRVWYLLVNE